MHYSVVFMYYNQLRFLRHFLQEINFQLFPILQFLQKNVYANKIVYNNILLNTLYVSILNIKTNSDFCKK